MKNHANKISKAGSGDSGLGPRMGDCCGNRTVKCLAGPQDFTDKFKAQADIEAKPKDTIETGADLENSASETTLMESPPKTNPSTDKSKVESDMEAHSHTIKVLRGEVCDLAGQLRDVTL